MGGTGRLLAGAGSAMGWAIDTGGELANRIPGADTVRRGAREVERVVLTELAERLRQLPGLASVVSAVADTDPLRSGMAELLRRAAEFQREGSAAAFYGSILKQLTPDEARIVAALADGEPFPVVRVTARTTLGKPGRVVLAGASTVGRQAGVALPENTPAYLARLRMLGLVEYGDEDEALATEYDILLTDQVVVDADDLARGNRRLPPRIVRETVRISPLGKRFWEACDPGVGG